jgi:hypothetical protein
MRHARLAVVAAVLVGALTLPSAAAAQISGVDAGQLTLGPDGASATVPVLVTCDAGYSIFGVAADVLQLKGNRIIRGSGFEFPSPALPCTGSPRTVQVIADNFGPFRFQNGRATVNVTVGLQGPSSVIQSFGPFEVRLAKK